MLSQHEDKINEFYDFFEGAKTSLDTQTLELLETTHLAYKMAIDELIFQFTKYFVMKVNIEDME